MNIGWPLFSANVLPTSVPYQFAGTFENDALVNTYMIQQSNMLQNYPMSYPTSMSPPVLYVGQIDPQLLSTVREARDGVTLDGTQLVKSASPSPVHSNPMFNNAAYRTECIRPTSEPVEMSGTNFATDVNTLMKAMQPTSSLEPELPKVS
jgi:hypothetical protein